jgi:hypothetical protein
MATHTAADATYAAVNTAYGLCTYGDTLEVPAGSETWASTLAITKGIYLKGVGSGLLTITANVAKLITFVPDATTRANQDMFDISWFTFAGAPATAVIEMSEGNSETVPIRKVRIHDNSFTNTTGYPISVDGNFWGVVYKNDFTGYLMFQFLGNQDTGYATFYPVSYGTADNLYFEDNTFGGTKELFVNCGHAARYALRYNTFTTTWTDEMFDQHGDQAGSIYATMICEIYGNLFSGAPSVNYWDMQRGGKLLMFNNRGTSVAGTADIMVYDDVDTMDDPIMWPHEDYFFNNWWNGANIVAAEGTDVGNHIAENAQFWNYDPAFDGSVGIGIGAVTPAMNCTTGVGYYVGAEGAIPPTTLADMKVKCQAGKLYRATATNVWTLYYQPYTYPHPLRDDLAHPYVMVY